MVARNFNIDLKKQNIVLIGMPSAGKTAVGQVLAAMTGKTLVDTDAEIVSEIGMPICEYFSAYGENSFRALERRMISDASIKNGCIIATGGGAILNQDNVHDLQQNGILVFLDRSLVNLVSTADRPLSKDRKSLENLFVTRYPIYKAAADVTIDADGTPEDVADAVLETLTHTN